MLAVRNYFNGWMCSGMANSFKYDICDSTKHCYQQDV